MFKIAKVFFLILVVFFFFFFTFFVNHFNIWYYRRQVESHLVCYLI